jgi:hypothetical protein
MLRIRGYLFEAKIDPREVLELWMERISRLTPQLKPMLTWKLDVLSGEQNGAHVIRKRKLTESNANKGERKDESGTRLTWKLVNAKLASAQEWSKKRKTNAVKKSELAGQQERSA